MQHISPSVVRPFCKRTASAKIIKRKKTKSEILTDTPIKEATKENFEERTAGQVIGKKRCSTVQDLTKQIKKRIALSESSSEDELPSSPICDDSSDESEPETCSKPLMSELMIDDHILVQFPGKTSCKYYVGRIQSMDIENDELETLYEKAT